MAAALPYLLFPKRSPRLGHVLLLGIIPKGQRRTIDHCTLFQLHRRETSHEFTNYGKSPSHPIECFILNHLLPRNGTYLADKFLRGDLALTSTGLSAASLCLTWLGAQNEKAALYATFNEIMGRSALSSFTLKTSVRSINAEVRPCCIRTHISCKINCNSF